MMSSMLISSYKNSYTARDIGISTALLLAMSLRALAVCTPSVTAMRSPKISSKVLPSPSAAPSEKLRDFMLELVRNKSPTPHIPIRVARSAPSALPRRAISVRPRVTRAHRALSPMPRPIITPLAMAITFFTAPPTCAPIMSLVK